MSGARMHFLEILLMRSITAIPVLALGFTPLAVEIYVLVAYVYTTLIHSNIGWRLPFIDQLLVTPQFHHWHHGADKEAIDVNFAIHFPFYDRLFGTYHLPKDQWPSGYGIEGRSVGSKRGALRREGTRGQGDTLTRGIQVGACGRPFCLGRVGTASRHSCIEVGLSALAQPRLIKGDQPYLKTPANNPVSGFPLRCLPSGQPSL